MLQGSLAVSMTPGQAVPPDMCQNVTEPSTVFQSLLWFLALLARKVTLRLAWYAVCPKIYLMTAASKPLLSSLPR